MSKGDWGKIFAFGVMVAIIAYFSTDAAFWIVGAAAGVIILSNPDLITGLF